MLAKFWLAPVSLAWLTGFSPVELRRVQAIGAEDEVALLKAWNEHFAG